MMKYDNDEEGFKRALEEMKPLFDIIRPYFDAKGNLSPDAPDKAKKAYKRFKEIESDLTTIYEPAPKK